MKSPFGSRYLSGVAAIRRGLARIDEDLLAGLAVVQQEEAATAETRTDRPGTTDSVDGHRDGGVERVAALRDDILARLRGERVRAGNRRTGRMRRGGRGTDSVGGQRGRRERDDEQQGGQTAMDHDFSWNGHPGRSACGTGRSAGLQPQHLRQQRFVGLRIRRIRVDAFHGAHDDTLRFVMMADAFGAAPDRSHRSSRPSRWPGWDRRVSADIAVDAEFVDLEGHDFRCPAQ